MSWIKQNWLWLLLAIAGAWIGWEIVSYLWAAASAQPATCWFNKMKFWTKGVSSGPGAQGATSDPRRECASCVPAAAHVCAAPGATQ